MSAILAAIVPVAFIILVGALGGRLFRLDVSSLSRVTVYLLAPALVIDGVYNSTLSTVNIARILAGFAIVSAVIAFLVIVVARCLDIPDDARKSLVAACVLPNNGNMGLPVASFALGTAGLERSIVYMIGSSFLLFGVAPAYLRGKGFRSGARLFFRLPLLWSLAIGVVFQVFSLDLPFQLDRAIEYLGEAAIPLALIVLGVQLADTRFAIGPIEVLGMFLRLVVAPLVAYLAGREVGLAGVDLKILVLQNAMPTAVNTVVLVTEFGGDASLMARLVVGTTLSSFLTLPIFLWGLR
jgi:predicted permease